MSRFISLIFVQVLALLFIIPVSAACPAADTSTPTAFIVGCSGGSDNAVAVTEGTGQEGTAKLVILVAERVLQFGALFAIGAIVFAGIRYTTSGGDDEKLKSAKNTGIYAGVGLILLLTAFPLVDIVVAFIYSLGS